MLMQLCNSNTTIYKALSLQGALSVLSWLTPLASVNCCRSMHCSVYLLCRCGGCCSGL